jgi:hypothetical protein
VSYLLVGALALLSVVFLVSATSKLRGPRDFETSLRELRILPRRWVGLVAAVITVAEVALAAASIVAEVGLLCGWDGGRVVAGGALAVAGLLLIGLTTGIALAIRRGTGGRCACFGVSDRPLGRRHLVRNGLLLVAAVLGGAGLGDRHDVTVAGGLVALAAGGLVALVLIHLDELVELFGSSPVASAATHPSTRR